MPYTLHSYSMRRIYGLVYYFLHSDKALCSIGHRRRGWRPHDSRPGAGVTQGQQWQPAQVLPAAVQGGHRWGSTRLWSASLCHGNINETWLFVLLNCTPQKYGHMKQSHLVEVWLFFAFNCIGLPGKQQSEETVTSQLIPKFTVIPERWHNFRSQLPGTVNS